MPLSGERKRETTSARSVLQDVTSPPKSFFEVEDILRPPFVSPLVRFGIHVVLDSAGMEVSRVAG